MVQLPGFSLGRARGAADNDTRNGPLQRSAVILSQRRGPHSKDSGKGLDAIDRRGSRLSPPTPLLPGTLDSPTTFKFAHRRSNMPVADKRRPTCMRPAGHRRMNMIVVGMKGHDPCGAAHAIDIPQCRFSCEHRSPPSRASRRIVSVGKQPASGRLPSRSCCRVRASCLAVRPNERTPDRYHQRWYCPCVCRRIYCSVALSPTDKRPYASIIYESRAIV